MGDLSHFALDAAIEESWSLVLIDDKMLAIRTCNLVTCVIYVKKLTDIISNVLFKWSIF
jgi:hypothetical protein